MNNGGKHHQNGETTEELGLSQYCLLQKIPCFPYPGLTTFWKIVIGANAALMIIFSLTLWMMAAEVTKLNALFREGKAEIVKAVDKIDANVSSHKQLTMENRVYQSEIRGMISTLVEDHKRTKLFEDRKP